MTTDAQARATARYQRENVKQVKVKLYPKDADVVAWLEGIEGRNSYIVGLIREDMERRRQS